MRTFLVRSTGVFTVAAGIGIAYDRRERKSRKAAGTAVPQHAISSSPPPPADQITITFPPPRATMSTGLAHSVAPSADADTQKHMRSGDDALESTRAGIAGHSASVAGVVARDADAETMARMPPFETTYAVPMHCSGCVAAAERAALQTAGTESATADLATGLLHVRGRAAPSVVVAALQAAGKDAILRGSGASNSAAVCILEVDNSSASATKSGASPVRGLARLVQVAPKHTLVDLTLSGLAPGTYAASITQTGDVSRGLSSLGGAWRGESDNTGRKTAQTSRGSLGMVEVDASGRGAAYIAHEMAVWEIIGRGMAVVRQGPSGADDGENAGAWGVLARSAGVWDNDKIVCSCSGKTVWQERQDQRTRGIS